MIVVVYGFFALVNEHDRRCFCKNYVLINESWPGIRMLAGDLRRNQLQDNTQSRSISMNI